MTQATDIEPRKIVITGATGNIASKLRAFLDQKGGYELRLLCLNPQNDPAVKTADLRDYSEDWAETFAGADAVVHLAVAPVPVLQWSKAHRDNIDMTLNVYHAAARHNVARVVFASSVWTMYGRRFDKSVCRPDMDPVPGISPYGMAKIFGERIGRAFAASHGLSTVALRIGTCARKSNLPGKHMLTGAWGQSCWVSNGDICRGIEQAVLAEDISFAVLNMTSANTPVRWSLEESQAVLGYAPQDSHATRVSARRKLQALVARIFFHVLPALSRRFIPPFW